MKRPPNWLEMPPELMSNILQRLGTVDILNSVWKVCATWRKICQDPTIWKVIDIDLWDACLESYHFEMLTKKAIDLSCGELIDFSVDGFGTDDLLNYLFSRSSKLNSLSLMNCEDISGRLLSRAVKKLPELEKLHISHTYLTLEDIEVIGQNCPQLKSFAMNQEFQDHERKNDNYALTIANNMPELRHLQVIGNKMTNKGLRGILNGCVHLESLDVRMCFKLNIKGSLEKLCVKRIKDFKRPNDSMKDCGYRPSRFDDMYLSEYSEYSDVDETYECDFYEDDDCFWRHQHV